MTSLRVISDVHGKINDYVSIVRKANNSGLHTLQLGDLGFYRTYSQLMNDKYFDVDINKFFRGNHDDYDFEKIKPCEELDKFQKFNLGEYGNVELNGLKLFFVRGAFSIDKKYRTIGADWWPNEEIEKSKWDEIIDLYSKSKPDLVVTHECPDSIGKDGILKSDGILIDFGFNPKTFITNTGILLDKLFEIHQPKKWIFGHFHKDWKDTVNGTEFICLKELGTIDL